LPNGTKLADSLCRIEQKQEQQGVKPKADYVLDFSQTITPFALLKMTQVMREMNRDEVLEIITRDAVARTDVFKLIPTASCEVIDMEFNKDANFFRIRVKRI
jgi:TusA-related sulfurtransferase